MHPEMYSVNATPSHPPKVDANFSLDEVIEMVTKMSVIYTSVEYVIMKDALNLCNSSRANLRRVQADIQKVRFKLLDSLAEKIPNKP